MIQKFKEYYKKTNEEVAAATGGNGSGMGAVVTASPSATPGQTTGGSGFSTPTAGDSYGNGATVGSGDIGSGWNQAKANNKSKKKKKEKKSSTDATKTFGKNLKNVANFDSYKRGGDKNAIQKFSDFAKKSSK
jgi:hypothetical protein